MLDAELLAGLVAIAQRSSERLAANLARVAPEYTAAVLARLSGVHLINARRALGQDAQPAAPRPLAPGISLKPDSEVLIDAELARIAAALGQLADFRLWAYAHACARDFNQGAGWVEKRQLFDYLKSLGIVNTWRSFNHRLQSGRGLYWKIGYGRSSDGSEHYRIYLTGYALLAERLALLALKENPDLVATNRPGAIKQAVNLSGTLKDAAAGVYNAWLALKDNRTIARATLRALWGRCTHTLLGYEAAAGVAKQANFSQHHETTGGLIPNHAYLCQNTEGKQFTSWRMANTYTAAPVIEHEHKGNISKARIAANSAIDAASQPVHECGDGLQPCGRVYFTEKRTARQVVNPFKAVSNHLRKHGDMLQRRHYARIGARHGVTVWEYTEGDNFTCLDNRDFTAEQAPDFQRQRHAYAISWPYRG